MPHSTSSHTCRAGVLLLAVFALSLRGLPAAEPSPSATAPSAAWLKSTAGRHEEFVAIAKAGNVDVLFLGDSITDYWRRPKGKAIWDRNFAPLKAANFGIAGDGVNGVLWRIQHGELEGIHPKVVVLLIGTNNVGQKADIIAAGIKDIITEIQTRSPGTRILLHAIFPRGEKPDAGGRARIQQVNAILATYAHPDDPHRVIYIDIGDRFLNPDKTMNKDLMPDTLHPSEKGYEVWAAAIIDTLKQQLTAGAQP